MHPYSSIWKQTLKNLSNIIHDTDIQSDFPKSYYFKEE